MEFLYVMIGIALGYLLKCLISTYGKEQGTLHVYYSEEDSPYIFLELNSQDFPKSNPFHQYVLLKLKEHSDDETRK